jgi:hypothetical protein
MLYVLDYTISTLTGSSSGRCKNFESKLQNFVIHSRRDPVWFTGPIPSIVFYPGQGSCNLALLTSVYLF